MIPSSLAEEVRLAAARAEALAADGRWQEVKIALHPLRGDIGDDLPALYLYARAHSVLQDTEPARRLSEEILVRARTVGDRVHEMKAANLLGIVLFETGRQDEAGAAFQQALEIAEALGEQRMQGMLSNNLGSLASLRDNAARAIRHFENALAIYREIGETRVVAQTLHNLGIAHRDLEEWDEAESRFTEAARAAQPLGDHRLFATSVVARADLALRKGDLVSAERMARAALLRFDVHSSLFGMAEVYKILGVVMRERSELEAAGTHLEKALSYCELHANPLIEAEIRLERGLLLQRQGTLGAAREDLVAAAEAFEKLGARKHAERAWLLSDALPAAGPSPHRPHVPSLA